MATEGEPATSLGAGTAKSNENGDQAGPSPLSALTSWLTSAFERPSSGQGNSSVAVTPAVAPNDEIVKPEEVPTHTRTPSGEAGADNGFHLNPGAGGRETAAASESAKAVAVEQPPTPAVAPLGPPTQYLRRESRQQSSSGSAAAVVKAAATTSASPRDSADEPLDLTPMPPLPPPAGAHTSEPRFVHRRSTSSSGGGHSGSTGGSAAGLFQSPPASALMQRAVSEEGPRQRPAAAPVTPLGGASGPYSAADDAALTLTDQTVGQIAYLKSNPSRRAPRGMSAFGGGGATGGGGGGAAGAADEVIYLADIDAVPGSADPSDIVVLEHRRRLRVKKDKDAQRRTGRAGITPRSRTPTRKRRQSSRRRKNAKELDPTEDEVEYKLSTGMMLGLRVAVGRQANPLESQELHIEDFYQVDKYVLPPRGARTGPLRTPSHSLGYTIKFKDYAPKVFKRIRENFGVDRSQYMLSVAGNYKYLEFVSNAKSGAFFFYSHDEKYMIKAMNLAETKFLRRILPHYYEHVRRHPDTCLVRFYGMYRVKMHHLHRKVHFVVMNSVDDTRKEIHRKYDLKGSTHGREAKGGEKVLKDLDLQRSGSKIHLGPQRDVFLQIVREDAKFLSRMKIMDYSLLLAVHDRRAPPDRSDGSPRRYSRFMNFVDGQGDASNVNSANNNNNNVAAAQRSANLALTGAASQNSSRGRKGSESARAGGSGGESAASGSASSPALGPLRPLSGPGLAKSAVTDFSAAADESAEAQQTLAAVSGGRRSSGDRGSSGGGGGALGVQQGGPSSDGGLNLGVMRRVSEVGGSSDEEEGIGTGDDDFAEEEGKETDGDGNPQDSQANGSTEWDETEDEADYSDFNSGAATSSRTAGGRAGSGAGGTDTDPEPSEITGQIGAENLRPPVRVMPRRQVSWSSPPTPLNAAGPAGGEEALSGAGADGQRGAGLKPASSSRLKSNKGRLLRRRHDNGLYSYVPKAAFIGNSTSNSTTLDTPTIQKPPQNALNKQLSVVSERSSVLSGSGDGSGFLGRSQGRRGQENTAGAGAGAAGGGGGGGSSSGRAEAAMAAAGSESSAPASGAAAVELIPDIPEGRVAAPPVFEWVRGDEIYFCAIIDILQEYNVRKHGETFFKGMMHDRRQISCIPPVEYAKRFCEFLEANTD